MTFPFWARGMRARGATVTAPGFFPVLPQGYVEVADATFDTGYVYTGGGTVLHDGFEFLTFPNGRGALIVDATAPSGTGYVIASKSPANFTPANMNTLQVKPVTVPPGRRKMGTAFTFRVDPAYINETNGIKLLYPRLSRDGAADGQWSPVLATVNGDTSGPLRLTAGQVWRWNGSTYEQPPLFDNRSGFSQVAPVLLQKNQWYKLMHVFELESVGLSDGPYDGVFREWVSSWTGSVWSEPMLLKEYTDVRYTFPPSGHAMTSIVFQTGTKIWDFYRGGSDGIQIPVDGFIYLDRFAVYTDP